MGKIKKGDIVGRKSYYKDILFVVERIIKTKAKKEIVILKGLHVRIKADADIDDLELIEKEQLEEYNQRLEKRFKEKLENYEKSNGLKRGNKIVYTGRILHLDGDRRYSEKSSLFYKKMGLRAVVRNIPESRQASMIVNLIERYKPDIVVITRT